jgi:hypothetical protein
LTAPSWFLAATAALMLLIAASCAARLAIWRPRGRATEVDADTVHVLMGVAMAGMLEHRLSLLPGVAWLGVFAAAAAWFSWQAVRARSRRLGGLRCVHPVPHAVECAAMLYMLLPARFAGHPPNVAMPGMSGPAAGSNPAIAVVLALFMLGYVLWTTDKLAGLSRASTAAAGRPGIGPSLVMDAPGPAISGRLTPRSLTPRLARGVASVPLAPRFAACYKIAMSIAMGYMLFMMV